MNQPGRSSPVSFAVLAAASGLLLAKCVAPEQAYEQGGETVFILGQAQQPVLMEGAVFGDALPAKTVILTYDDGPDEHTLELAQYLADNDIRATFFINGSRICKTMGQDGVCLEPMDTRACDDGLSQAPVEMPIYYPESLLHEIVMLGHRLANHTTDHCHLPAQDTPENFVFELQGTQEIIDRHICDGLYLFRAPYGEWDPQAAALAQAEPGLDKLIGPIQWDIDGLDWSCFQQGTPAATCGDGYLNILRGRAQQNGIFLLHDRPEFNVGSEGPLLLTQYMVPILKAEGYSFTTLDDLLEHTPTGEMACPFDEGSGGAGGAGGGGAGGVGSNASAGGGAGGAAGASQAGSEGIAGATPTSGGAGSSGGGSAGVGATAGSGTAGTENTGAAGSSAVVAPTAGAPTAVAATNESQTTGCTLSAAPEGRTDGPQRGWLALAGVLAGLTSRRRWR